MLQVCKVGPEWIAIDGEAKRPVTGRVDFVGAKGGDCGPQRIKCSLGPCLVVQGHSMTSADWW